MNPYLILAGLLALAAAAGGGFYEGRVTGINAQKVADAAQLDKVNADLTRQKAEANQALQTALQHNADTLAERDRLKTTLETAHAQNVAATNSLRTELAGVRLAFQSAGRGGGGGGAAGGAAGAPDDASAPECIVPEIIAGRLRELAYQADSLRDDYILLYNWAHAENKISQ